MGMRKLGKTYTEDDFKRAVKENYSVAGVIRQIGLESVSGGNYKTVKILVKRFKLNTSHWTGQGHLKNKTHNWTKAKPYKEILVKNSTYRSTGALKRRLIKDKILVHICSICKIDSWNNVDIVLQLDHINGDNMDNRIENLRLLCPNCHSQTDTYCGKNIVNKINKSDGRQDFKKKHKKISACISCGKNISYSSTRCKSCDSRKRTSENRKVKSRPTYDTLKKEIQETSYCAVGRKYGVSDNSIRKWIRMYEKYYNKC